VTDDVHAQFREAVTMSVSELEKWLHTDEAREVGQKSAGGGESVGHDSGRRIVTILGKKIVTILGKKADLIEADEAHMRKVVGYVHRHLAQRPKADVEDTRWRYSLMNWGHDPLKE
jgi:hypothetical protein